MQSKKNKNRIQQELEKSVKSFMNNEAEKAFVSLDNLEKMGIPKNERGNVQKVTLLLLAGTFYGIHTLKNSWNYTVLKRHAAQKYGGSCRINKFMIYLSKVRVKCFKQLLKNYCNKVLRANHGPL